MRIPITSQLAALVLALAAWSAWQAPAGAPGPDHALRERGAGRFEIVVENAHLAGASSRVRVCGRTVGVVDGRASVELAPMASDCSAVATRWDGDYLARSEPVVFDARRPMTLVLPDYRLGGIGVEVEERSGRVYVKRVMERGSAREAGLREGDQMLADSGAPFRTVKEMQAEILGPEGTWVRVRALRWEGHDLKTFSRSLERRSDVE